MGWCIGRGLGGLGFLEGDKGLVDRKEGRTEFILDDEVKGRWRWLGYSAGGGGGGAFVVVCLKVC